MRGQLLATTQDKPPAERLAYWNELMATSLGLMNVRSENPDEFIASVRTTNLGALNLALHRFPSLRVTRSRSMVRPSDPDLFLINLTLRGGGVIQQARNRCVARVGQLSAFDSSTPHEIDYVEGEGGTDSTALTLQIPRALLPVRPDLVKRLYATCLTPEPQGVGAVLISHLVAVARHAHQLRPEDATRLGGITLDLVAATIAHRLDREADLPPDTRQAVTYRQVLAFIEAHLAGPELTPASIAAAHHVSVRSLYRLFAAEGRTVAGWIRHRRLDRCRRDLADPRLAGQPIHAVAARWGFTDSAHFTRLFTAAVGMGPLAYRQDQHLIR
ncbi:helix-turn-helix domain-containing protein [Solwaraspora sp. WMMD1047]|uniref:helix-turn-helix domain-containing protein n=1 Tax=Solwaraspora sp. WMMD1047 TaxID=3016102 RepID=UPI0024162703|nr:helix-turn-helix domain-containing protein [Solwaraspora sp. WMMD1047]MDG4831418.1 helix-turn-helix domain-containing protein [Solwaraspora sp. WMMD1047]